MTRGCVRREILRFHALIEDDIAGVRGRIYDALKQSKRILCGITRTLCILLLDP